MSTDYYYVCKEKGFYAWAWTFSLGGNQHACGSNLLKILEKADGAELILKREHELYEEEYYHSLEMFDAAGATEQPTPSAQMRSAESWANEWIIPQGILRDCRVQFVERIQADAIAMTASHEYTKGYEDAKLEAGAQSVDDEDVKLVAAALEKFHCQNLMEHELHCQADEAIDAFTRILTRAGSSGDVPEGWKLVPVEMTHEMFIASELKSPYCGDIDVAQAWKRMLAAAPPTIRKIKS